MLKYVAARPHAISFVLITSTFTCVMSVSSHIIILILCLFVRVSMYKRDIRESLGTNMFSLSCRGVNIMRILIIMFLNFRNYTSIPWVKIDNVPIHFYVILLTFALSLETKMYCAIKHLFFFCDVHAVYNRIHGIIDSSHELFQVILIFF